MTTSLKNVLVLGGSYVGMATTKELASLLPATHRILLVEPHSHFHHLFAFPRFAVLPSHEHKAFIPYTGAFAGSAPSQPPPPSSSSSPASSAAAAAAPSPQHRHAVVQARVTSLTPEHAVLDREWQGSTTLAYDYVVVATGTRLQAPGSMPDDEKPASVAYFRRYQAAVARARSVLVVGGGAVGVQMACDLKELHPDKEVTLVHSRRHIMPLYHEELSNIIKARFAELGVKTVLGSRVVMPPEGLPQPRPDQEGPMSITLQDGTTLSADLVIPAVGQTANTQFLAGLLPNTANAATAPDAADDEMSRCLVNPVNGFVHVRPTLQFADPRFPHLFAVGDVADSGAHKAARPGAAQAAVVARNVAALIAGREPLETIVVGPPAIHLSLGLTKNLIFRNPDVAAGDTEPTIKHRDDGQADMGIEGVWVRRGVVVKDPAEYHL